jgi:predicted ATPase
MKCKLTIRGVHIELSHVITPQKFGFELRRGTKGDYDFPTVITGKPRRGKSVLAVLISRGFSKNYTHERCMIYSDNQFKNAIQNFRDMPIIVDEAVKMFLASNATAGKTKDAIIALNVCGNQHNQILFVLPFLTDLVKSIREKRAQYWIYIITRGLGVIFKSNDGLIDTEDFWMPKILADKLKNYRSRYGEILGTIYAVQEMPTFRNFIVWDKLEDADYAEYEKIKDAKKYEDDSLEIESMEIRKARENLAIDFIVSLMKLEGGKRKKYIQTSRGILAGMLGTSEATLRTKIRQRALIAGVLTEEDKEKEGEEIDFESLIVGRTDADREENKLESTPKEENVKIEELIDLGDEFDEVTDA